MGTSVLRRSRLQRVGPVGVADGALALLGAGVTQHRVLARQHHPVLLLTLKAFH